MTDQNDFLDDLPENLPEDFFNQDFTDDERERGWRHTERLLEEILGPSEPLVLHSIVPFCIGGALDLYYYANSRFGGTFFASQELTAPEFLPSNRSFNALELAIATRLTVKSQPELTISGGPESTKKPGFFKRLFGREKPVKSPEEKKRDDLHRVLTNLAFYVCSDGVEVNGGETLEFPQEFEDEQLAGRCFIFDELPATAPVPVPTSPDKRSPLDGKRFGVLLAIEVFREEMNWAREQGTEKLVERLKDAGAYPFSDLDREPVV
ncbi:MAG: suppressor of fused domain protein [Thermoguttaceae bacterium]|nr:suppressor of fused domain protein [Thermoguttaceae bacterium]